MGKSLKGEIGANTSLTPPPRRGRRGDAMQRRGKRNKRVQSSLWSVEREGEKGRERRRRTGARLRQPPITLSLHKETHPLSRTQSPRRTRGKTLPPPPPPPPPYLCLTGCSRRRLTKKKEEYLRAISEGVLLRGTLSFLFFLPSSLAAGPFIPAGINQHEEEEGGKRQGERRKNLVGKQCACVYGACDHRVSRDAISS